jgi:dipeptidyl-peptidase 4
VADQQDEQDQQDTFPRQYARTRRLTLGEPRDITVSPDGARVVFLRSRGGSDPVTCLWVLDVASGSERLVADPLVLLAERSEDDLPPEERARRERAREQASGIVAYATNQDVTVAAFAINGRLFGAALLSGMAREIPVEGPVFDPRPDPAGRRIAYVSGPALRLAELDGRSRVLAGEDAADVTWGSAEFVAAEEMDRLRGYWWSPDGERVAAARVDNAPVAEWWISDPAQPDVAPISHRYPAAGTADAVVTLYVLALDGSRVEITWDRAAFPYLADVAWTTAGLAVTVVAEDQHRLQVLAVDATSGRTSMVWEDSDAAWVDLTPGVPALLPGARLVTCANRDGARRLVVDGQPVTPADLHVRAVSDASPGAVTFTANAIDEPTSIHVWRWQAGNLTKLTDGAGVHGVAVGGSTTVVRSVSLDWDGVHTTVLDGPSIASHAETPLVRPNVTLVRAGSRELDCAVVLPHEHDGSPLPVLLDPYGGPGHARVQAARAQYLTSQWFADQGFAVVVIDGRGVPGRGSEWERGVHLDLAGPVLDDQVDGLQGLAARFPLDMTKVAIRGWSFGGYLAALAVLRRPDVFHAAVVGAPVTDWRLYDTYYTERFLGDPTLDPTPYDQSSVLGDAPKLERPILLIHGLADDNVVAAHSLRLSSALLAAGKPHQVLPLSGVTHMTPQEVVAENLLLLQLQFLRDALDLRPPASPPPTP